MQDGRSTDLAGLQGAEGSVMFSLRELRDLEVERIEDEIAADRRRQAQREEAQRAAAAAEAARIAEAQRAEIARQQAMAEERERDRRRDELELIAIEARLDQEEQERLETVRRAAEAQAAIDIKRASPVRKVVGIVGAVVAFGGITVALLMRSGDAELARTQADLKAQARAAQQVVDEANEAEVARFTTQLAGLQSELAAAQAREQAAQDAARAAQREEARAHQVTPRHHRVATAGASRPEAKSPASAPLDSASESILDNL